jgi:hypothetical protein
LLVQRLELVARVLRDFRERRIASEIQRLADIVLDACGLACAFG